MLSDLIAGYSSSEGEGGEEGENKSKEAPAEKKVEEKPMEVVKPKKKLPSAAAMMASTTSWARGDEPGPAELVTDKLGKKYNNVAPPKGVRAEDGVMGGGADYIKPIQGHSLDANKVYEGTRMLSKTGPGCPLVPPQVSRGKKNVSTEDVGSWTTETKKTKKR